MAHIHTNVVAAKSSDVTDYKCDLHKHSGNAFHTVLLKLESPQNITCISERGMVVVCKSGVMLTS